MIKKKGFTVVTGVLTLMVIVIAGYLTFSLIVGPNSPSNWLMDFQPVHLQRIVEFSE